jgi:hypothetical protein
MYSFKVHPSITLYMNLNIKSETNHIRLDSHQ